MDLIGFTYALHTLLSFYSWHIFPLNGRTQADPRYYFNANLHKALMSFIDLLEFIFSSFTCLTNSPHWEVLRPPDSSLWRPLRPSPSLPWTGGPLYYTLWRAQPRRHVHTVWPWLAVVGAYIGPDCVRSVKNAAGLSSVCLSLCPLSRRGSADSNLVLFKTGCGPVCVYWSSTVNTHVDFTGSGEMFWVGLCVRSRRSRGDKCHRAAPEGPLHKVAVRLVTRKDERWYLGVRTLTLRLIKAKIR